jgi:hypothetical protein
MVPCVVNTEDRFLAASAAYYFFLTVFRPVASIWAGGDVVSIPVFSLAANRAGRNLCHWFE